MSSTRSATDATFKDEVLKATKTTIVDFWADWCGPCRAVSPILEQIAAEHVDKVDVVKVNVDENPRTTLGYGITSIPAMVVFQDGKAVDTVIGARPKPDLEKAFERYLD